MHTETTRKNELARAQERALRSAAGRDGDWCRLAIFHWLRDDKAALQNTIAQAPDDDRNVQAIAAMADLGPLSEDALDHEYLDRPWLLWYLTRFWIRQGDPARAVAAARQSLECHSTYSPGFTLLLFFAARLNRVDLVGPLAKKLLDQNPDQADIRHLLEQPRHNTEGPKPAERPPPRVGFYIPVFNAAPHLDAVLKSILEQAYPLEELVVVDDGSTDNSADIAASYPLRLIRHGRNRGLAAARNTALRAMESDYCASCDSDAVLDPDYLLYTALELQCGPVRPAGVGGRMTEQYDDTLADLWRNVHMSQDSGLFRKCSGHGDVGPVYLPGCNTVLHRKTALDLGGYDESYVAVGEDGQMSRALHRGGHLLVTTPLARCYHLRRDTPWSALRTRWNYEREGHEGVRAFDSLGNLIRLFHVHLSTAKTMAQQDNDRNLPQLTAMEALFVVSSFLHSLGYSRSLGHITLGQQYWLQCALLHGTMAGDALRINQLRAWRDHEIAPVLLPPDTPIQPLPPYYGTQFIDAFAAYDRWLAPLEATLNPPPVSATR